MRWSEVRQVEGKPIKEEWQREIEKGGTDWKKKEPKQEMAFRRYSFAFKRTKHLVLEIKRSNHHFGP